MAKPIVVTEVNLKEGCKHDAYHEFPLPHCTEAGFYRSTVSYNAFFHGLKDRNRTKNKLFVAHDKQELSKRWYPDYFNKTVSIIEHNNIWDFYKYIGYDYKKKRFLKNGS